MLLFLTIVLSLSNFRASSAPVQAAITITVTSTADGTLANLATNTTCDLREAIEAANTNTTVGQCVHDGSAGSDTIIFDPAVTGTITLTQGQLTISGDLTITGPGSANLSISGNNTGRVFYINRGTSITLADLTVTGGSDDNGGGIFNNGVLIITGNAEISGNVSTGDIFSGGAGILNRGRLTIQDNVSVSGNTTKNGRGGGIRNYGRLTIMGSASISNNHAWSGGGLENYRGTATIMNSVSISGNSAYVGGGGIFNIFSGEVMIQDNALVSGNTAERGGGIDNVLESTVTLQNDASVSENTAYSGGGIHLDEGTVIIQDTASVTGNLAMWSDGGGIYNRRGTLTIQGNASVDGNTARNGGGIFNFVNGTVRIEGGATVSGNTASIVGGGIFHQTGTMTLDGSSVSNNTADDRGGGIYIENGSLTIQNGATVSGNTAGSHGGGIYNWDGTVTMQTNATVDSNTTDLQGGGIFNWLGTLTIQTGASVSENTASVNGGGIRNHRGTVIVDGASVANNTAYRGGGIYNQRGGFTLRNNALVSNNMANYRGGGIFNFDVGTVTIQSGATVNSNTATKEGGGLFINRGNVTLQNGAVIAGNTGSRGGGLFNYQGQVTGTGSVVMGNVISTRAGGAWFEVPGTTASSITGSCINGNDARAVFVRTGQLTATGNWWGAADGPGSVGPGSGDQINAGVLYDPFLTAPPAGLDCTIRSVIILPGVDYPDPNSGMDTEQTGPSAADHARAQAPLCADLDGTTNPVVRADVPGGTVTEGSVFCRIIAENGSYRSSEHVGEVGDAGVLERGVIQAVDVFGLRHDGSSEAVFNTGVSVCLQGTGALLYLDATVAPRMVVELPTWTHEGYTCATIPNAGTVVLVPGVSSQVVPPVSSGADVSLSGCMVTTKNLMNLRSGPDTNSDIIRQIPYDVKLTAFARQDEWFQVDYLGTVGWLSAAYVTPDGACGP